jgi:hypothetical protein
VLPLRAPVPLMSTMRARSRRTRANPLAILVSPHVPPP